MEELNRCELEIDLSQTNQNESPAGSWLCCLPCYWLRKNSGFHKMSLSIVTLLVTVLLVASPVLFLISSLPEEKPKNCRLEREACSEGESEKVCVTEECSKAGNRILASISWKANPCQDFYRFACGSWAEKPQFSNQNRVEFQEDHIVNFIFLQRKVEQNIKRLLSVNGKSDPFQKLRTFYKSCIREKHKKTSFLPMFSVLEELGGYVAPNENPPEDLTDLVLNLLRLNGAPVFDIYLDSDLDNSSKSAPFIDLPFRFGFNLAFNHWWHRNQNHLTPGLFLAKKHLSEIILSKGKEGIGGYNKAYNFKKAAIEEKRLLVMEKIMRNFMSGNFSYGTIIREIQNTIHFANIITKIFPKEKEIIESYQEESNAKMTAEELERKFPFIRWQYLLEEFFKAEICPQDEIFVLAPDYMEVLQRILQKFPFRIIHNGLLLIFATDTLYELVNTSSSRDWTSFCNKMTMSAFGKAVSILYVRQFGQEYVGELRIRVTNIFNTLKKSFNKRIKQISWLDEKTKEAALEKLSNLEIQFLSWPNYWNASYANSLMKDVQVHSEDFFGNVIKRYRQIRNVSVNFKQNQFEEKRWAYPFIVNAFYVHSLNTIGLIIAHEILHGFDLKGINHNLKGSTRILMSQGSRAEFETRLDCFIKQFSSSLWRKVHFLGTNVDVQFDWNMTKNENMADTSGLQMTYQAWKILTESENEWYLPGVNLNPHQLFFLNAAQTYCAALSPADYIFFDEVDFHRVQPERVNGIMMNSPGFAEAFRCPVESPMNPRRKCSTW